MDQQKADIAGPKLVASAAEQSSGKSVFDDNRLPVISAENQQDRVGVAPWLPSTMLVVRSEVLRATRGWDQAWQHPQLRDAELSLRARARDFKVICVGSAVAICNSGESAPDWSPEEARMFKEKWRDYSDLFGSSDLADLSAILSPGLLDN